MSFWRQRKKSEGVERLQGESEATIEDSSEKYCRSEMYRFPAGEDLHFVYCSLDRSAHSLSSQMLHLLDSCSTFKTISDHARSYFNATTNIGDISEVERQLTELASAGLLISYGDLEKHCRYEAVPSTDGFKIGSVGVVTRNRIRLLQRCLSSYIKNVKKYGRKANFVCVDDSPENDTQRATKDMLSELKSSYEVDILYADLKEKSRFAKILITTGDLPSHVVNFALFDSEGFGYSVGANRNALALDTLGDLVFSVDDDTECYLVTAPNTMAEVTLNSRDDFMNFWFYKDRKTALNSNPQIDIDVLSIHERLLGRGLSTCIANEHGNGRLFDRVNPRYIRDLQSGDGIVLATFMGIVGDSAMPAPVCYLTLKGRGREELMKSRQAYSSAFRSREILRATDRFVLDRNAWCITTAYAYDNRDWLPPYMPVGRGEDDVFGFTMQSCFEKGYLGYVPCAVLHAPPEERFYRPTDFSEFGSKIDMCTLILACVTSFTQWPNSIPAQARLEKLGKYLMEIGSLKQDDFEEFLRIHLLRMNSDFISVLEAQLQEHQSSPDFWTNDAEAYLDIVTSAVTTKDYIVPQDVIRSVGVDHAREHSKRLVFKFGELLYWWTAIIDTARRLKLDGTRMATAV
jgi:hypothetical protein